jgi:hypothetical protein
MPERILRDRIAAKLTVLIEGIADHKMTDHSREMLAKEIVDDITQLCDECAKPLKPLFPC